MQHSQTRGAKSRGSMKQDSEPKMSGIPSSSDGGNSDNGKKGRKGDPRMYKACCARLANPSLSLFEALLIGGFKYYSDTDPQAVDADSVTLSQRKNQLSRRIRQARKQQEEERLCRQLLEQHQHAIEAKRPSQRHSADGHEDQQIEQLWHHSNTIQRLSHIVSMDDAKRLPHPAKRARIDRNPGASTSTGAIRSSCAPALLSMMPPARDCHSFVLRDESATGPFTPPNDVPSETTMLTRKVSSRLTNNDWSFLETTTGNLPPWPSSEPPVPVAAGFQQEARDTVLSSHATVLEENPYMPVQQHTMLPAQIPSAGSTESHHDCAKEDCKNPFMQMAREILNSSVRPQIRTTPSLTQQQQASSAAEDPFLEKIEDLGIGSDHDIPAVLLEDAAAGKSSVYRKSIETLNKCFAEEENGLFDEQL